MNLFNIIKEELDRFVEELNLSNLRDIPLKTNLPQVNGVGKFSTVLNDDSIEILNNKFEPNKLYDFIVDVNGNLKIGGGHYRLSQKASNVKAAGEIKVDKYGKIIYLNNESGHYEPTKEDIQAIADEFKKMNLTSPNFELEKRY